MRKKGHCTRAESVAGLSLLTVAGERGVERGRCEGAGHRILDRVGSRFRCAVGGRGERRPGDAYVYNDELF